MNNQPNNNDGFIIKNNGYCVCCDSDVTFSSTNLWLRDYYICSNCKSIPRERALMYCINMFYPNWRELLIHESSPCQRGASLKLKRQCQNYIATQYFPDKPLGERIGEYQNEDLENQTFKSGIFDLVITQDVMEHVFSPEMAFAEIARTLKPGGAHIFTVPLINKHKPTEIWAKKAPDGSAIFLNTPEYHGNPINKNGSPVTMHWGYDICDYILKNSGLYTTIVFIDNLDLGIRAEYIEVLISRKI